MPVVESGYVPFVADVLSYSHSTLSEREISQGM
jgi:hypothetical protein